MRLRERSPGLWKQRGYIGIGNRRGMGGMTFRERIAALMNGSEFFAPLTHSAVPTRAASGTTGTFTRTTTETWPNNDGFMVTGVAGEIGFVGARRVYNLWTTSSVSLANGANKSLTLAAGTYAFSMGAGTGTATFSGTGGATGTLAASASGRVSVNKTITAGTFVVTASVADLADLQVESLTAQTTQTAGEYVSVGVGDIAVPLGNTDFSLGQTVWTFETGATVSGGKLQINSSSGPNVYQLVGRVGVGCEITVVVDSISGGIIYVKAGAIPGTAISSAGTYTYVASTNPASALVGIVAQTGVTVVATISRITARWLDHGSGVDGVKCFPTDLSGNPLTGMPGYQAQGARTNLCLQSNDFSNASWVKVLTPSETQNVVGPDGATSAWTLTDNSAVALEYIRQTSSALTAANYTFSVFIKKTTGAQTAYPVVQVTTGATGALCTVDTTNGVATVWTAYTGLTIVTSSASCVSHNSDYWRVSLVFLGVAATHDLYLFPACTTNATQSTGTFDVAAQASHVFYGAQVELGSFASSYIATTTLAVARNKDEESVSTSGNIEAAAGSVYLEYTPTHTPSGTVAFWGTYVDANNYTAILHDATNLIFRKRIAGVDYDATIVNAFVAGTTYKACATWGTTGTSITLNGTEGTPHANTTAAKIAATMQWGADGNSAQQPFASIRNCRDWTRHLSASERAAITS